MALNVHQCVQMHYTGCGSDEIKQRQSTRKGNIDAFPEGNATNYVIFSINSGRTLVSAACEEFRMSKLAES